jgi:hypothetical protein
MEWQTGPVRRLLDRWHMRSLCASAVFLMLVGSPRAASAGVDKRVTVGFGPRLGRTEHPDQIRGAGGVHVLAELQLWWLILGGTAGSDANPFTGGAPIHALAVATHLGVAAPLYQRRPGNRLHEIRVRAAVEIGRHYYSVSGEGGPVLHVLDDGKRTYESPRRPTTFTGERAGVSYSVIGAGGTGVVVALEAAHRSDRHAVDIDYHVTSCGGLFTTGCSESSGMTTLGGRELSLIASVGLVIGR